MEEKKKPVEVRIINGVEVTFLSDPVETGLRILAFIEFLAGQHKLQQQGGPVLMELPVRASEEVVNDELT